MPGRDRARCFFLDAEPKISLDARGSLQVRQVRQEMKIFSHSSMLDTGCHQAAFNAERKAKLTKQLRMIRFCLCSNFLSFCEFPQDSRHDDMSVLVERTAEPVFIFAVTSCRQGLWLGGFILSCVNALGRGKTREDSKTVKRSSMASRRIEK